MRGCQLRGPVPIPETDSRRIRSVGVNLVKTFPEDKGFYSCSFFLYLRKPPLLAWHHPGAASFDWHFALRRLNRRLHYDVHGAGVKPSFGSIVAVENFFRAEAEYFRVGGVE